MMRLFVAAAFAAILLSLGSALFFLMKDKGKPGKTLKALALRVSLSISLFLFILFAYWMGWIQYTGIHN